MLIANWESNVGYAWWLMENFWVTISNHLDKKGIKSFLLYPKITTIPEKITDAKIVTVELNFFDRKISNMINLYRFIRNNNIRYVYLTDAPSYNWFYILLRLFGVNKIITHDHTPGERSTPSYGLKILKTLIHKTPFFTADHIVAVTEYVHQRHLTVNCIPSKKCSVASNGIYPIDLTDTDFSYAYKQFKIPENRSIIVTTGRASYYKGIDFFIKCANELINKQKLKNLHFIFCGDGPDIEQFKSLCAKYALADNFTFAGRRTDIKKILPSCTIGFHAATGEVGYSLSILEYMSSGLITIVPNSPSVSQAIIHSKNGYLYVNKDLFSACDTIKSALSNKDIDAIKICAIHSVEKNFNIENTNNKLANILEREILGT